MKPIIKSSILLFLLFIGVSLHAQTAMTYERIPMAGAMEPFAQKLVHQGYKLLRSYYRDGLGTSDLTIRKKDGLYEITVCAGESRTVDTIHEYHPERRDWAELMQDYTINREALTKTFGQPKDIIDGFPEDMSQPFRSLREGTAQYRTEYITPNGTVTLQIQPTKKHGRIQATYKNN